MATFVMLIWFRSAAMFDLIQKSKFREFDLLKELEVGNEIKLLSHL